MMRRIKNRKTPPTSARPTNAQAYRPSLAAVTSALRSSMANRSTHGPRSDNAVASTRHTSPAAN